jgi:hydrogenase-4 component F
MVVAGAFMVRQGDYKRMLAYSSVEHMGILVLGIAIGGAGTFGALLHLLNNGLSKGVLFLSAGNIHRAFGSKRISEVSGALRLLPASGSLFLAGFRVQHTAVQPVSEFTILTAIVRRTLMDRGGVPGLCCWCSSVWARGAGSRAGDPPARAQATQYRDGWLGVAPIAVLLLLVLAPL